MEILKEIIEFVKAERKWWLVPIISILLIIGFVIVFAGGSVFSPLIYTMF